MFKRMSFFVLLTVSCFAVVYSQQITKFAVVDLNKVYTAFFADSRAVREWNERSANVQREIERRTNEIQELRARLANAIQQDNQPEINRLEADINRRTDNLRDYHQGRIAELERERSRLTQNSTFLNQVNEAIRWIAESEGYSMVLNLNNNPEIIWYSHSVDITEKVVQRLQRR